ncbi:MAG TPA: outer membrane lipid asymmetry maintenance protein MlaD [bacterium]|nr:outer membrane lipid asymmetry maintenance protein MlaD [Syntrophobacteraceae bacterium]HQH74113.1 outer membrane lipid asymmetry maintenance protein MlaD [bacterium]
MEKRGVELAVGTFLLLGLLCLAYLSIELGKVRWLGYGDYRVEATFANVGGLKANANVTMAGVQIGKVETIRLKDGRAWVTLSIQGGVKLEEDVIARIKTMGIIGDKYVSITPGASETYIPPGGTIRETQPPLDIEELVGKFVFGSMEKTQK